MVIARYPRLGQLLAPAMLRPLLDVPVPARLVRRFPKAGLNEMRLADLDATSWERFGTKACYELAHAVVKQVSRTIISVAHTAVREQRLPTVERAMSVDDLPLGTRTHNCLYQARLNGDAQRLGEVTIEKLLKLRGFGAKCLVDLLVSLEMPTVPSLSPPKIRSARSLSWSEWACGEYPKLPPNSAEWTFPELPPTLTLDQLDVNRRTRHCLHHSPFGKNIPSLSGQPIGCLLKLPSFGMLCLRSLLRALNEILHPVQQPLAPDLETEMMDVFQREDKAKDCKTTRNRHIFSRVFGLDGQGGALLAAVGTVEGLTRERVRQVCLLRPRPGRAFPLLKSALQVVAELLPAPVADLEAELVRRGLAGRHVPLRSLIRFARALKHPLPFKIINADGLCWVVRSDEHDQLLFFLLRATRRRLLAYGAASFAYINARVARWIKAPVDPTVARRVIGSLPGFHWLDEAMGWFWLSSAPSNPLLYFVRKILAGAAGPLTVDELCDCIRRLPKGRFDALPSQVLDKFCRRMPGVRVEGDLIFADPPLDWRVVLRGVERDLVGIFHDYGPVLSWKELKKHGLERGLSKNHLYMSLRKFPVIRRCGRSDFVLCGAPVKADKSAALDGNAQNKASPSANRPGAHL